MFRQCLRSQHTQIPVTIDHNVLSRNYALVNAYNISMRCIPASISCRLYDHFQCQCHYRWCCESYYYSMAVTTTSLQTWPTTHTPVSRIVFSFSAIRLDHPTRFAVSECQAFWKGSVTVLNVYVYSVILIMITLYL